ncbi:MAG: DUF4062 domain-containing protein, partial [Moraxellaceae bacterium]
HAEHHGAVFHPVGWEDIFGGVGRPQELINEKLKECDYAVFVLHDRWGSPTGTGYTSGTEEEWKLAEKLYKDNKIRNIALFFKNVDLQQLRDPGRQLERVLEFKSEIAQGKRYLFKEYRDLAHFSETLEGHLTQWLRDHGSATSNTSAVGLIAENAPTLTPADIQIPFTVPNFDYWIAEANKLLNADTPDYVGAIFCASKAIDLANSDTEWARAKNIRGVAQFHLGRLDEAFAAFNAIYNRMAHSTKPNRHKQVAQALLNKASTLGALGRSADAIAIYDELLARFGAATELPLRKNLAQSLIGKGAMLDILGRSAEEIIVYDELLARFGAATELSLREQVATALYNKGITLSLLGRSADA